MSIHRGNISRHGDGRFYSTTLCVDMEAVEETIRNNPYDAEMDERQKLGARKAEQLAKAALRRHGATYAAARLGVQADAFLDAAIEAEAVGNKIAALDNLAAARNHRAAARRLAT